MLEIGCAQRGEKLHPSCQGVLSYALGWPEHVLVEGKLLVVMVSLQRAHNFRKVSG